MSRERSEAHPTDISGGVDSNGQFIRLPLTRPERIGRWFLILEAQFKIARIVSDKAKYNAVITNLGEQQLDLVDDIVSVRQDDTKS
jgi:phage terminase large subunit-like protein